MKITRSLLYISYHASTSEQKTCTQDEIFIISHKRKARIHTHIHNNAKTTTKKDISRRFLPATGDNEAARLHIMKWRLTRCVRKFYIAVRSVRGLGIGCRDEGLWQLRCVHTKKVQQRRYSWNRDIIRGSAERHNPLWTQSVCVFGASSTPRFYSLPGFVCGCWLLLIGRNACVDLYNDRHGTDAGGPTMMMMKASHAIVLARIANILMRDIEIHHTLSYIYILLSTCGAEQWSLQWWLRCVFSTFLRLRLTKRVQRGLEVFRSAGM